MASKTKVGGTAYKIAYGKTKIGGTAYDIDRGRTKIGGTGMDIIFGAVPHRYTQVQYIASTAQGSKAPYIVLPITTQEGLQIDAVINKYGSDDNLCYLGYSASGNAQECFMLIANGNLYAAYMQIAGQGPLGNYKTVADGTTITCVLKFGSKGQTTSLSCGSTWSASMTRSNDLSSTGNPMYLFSQTGAQGYKGRFGRVTAYDSSNNVIMDLYPVTRNSDSEPGFWDAVSRTFLTNAGSGSFSAGPNV